MSGLGEGVLRRGREVVESFRLLSVGAGCQRRRRRAAKEVDIPDVRGRSREYRGGGMVDDDGFDVAEVT